MSRRLIVLMVLAGAFAPGQLRAQDAVLRARERAQTITEFRAMLEHSDAATRLAAFEEAVASKDQALLTLAMDAAFGGTDLNLKTAALRVYLNGRKMLPITVLLPDRASDAAAQYFGEWNGLVMTDLKVVGNEISAKSGNAMNSFRGGQLTAGGLDLRYGGADSCSLRAQVVDAKQLTGSLDCSLGVASYRSTLQKQLPRAVFPVRIDLP